MKAYEYFDHTADAKFRAYGRSFEEALKNLVLAVYGVIVDPETIKLKKKRKIVVTGRSRESLVYSLMEEIVFLLDTESFLAGAVDKLLVREDNGFLVCEALLLGDDNPRDYDVFGQIKSATYHEMLIGEENGNVFIQAVVDI